MKKLTESFKNLKLRTKLFLGLLLTYILIIASVTICIVSIYRSRMEKYYTELARNIDKIFADEITSEDIDRYMSTREKDERFEYIHRRMNDAIKEFNLASLYVLVPIDEESYTYVIDGTDYDDEEYCDLGTVDKCYGEFAKNSMNTVWSGGVDESSVSNSEEYGYLVSVGSLIKDKEGNPSAAVVTDIYIDMVNLEIRNIVFSTISIASLVALLTMVCYFVYIRMFVIVPILKLEHAASEFPQSEDEEGNLQVTEERYESGDEIGTLFKSVVEMEKSIVTFMHNLKTVTAERERIGAELNVATEIQASYLPSIFPPFPDRKEFDIYASMYPAKEVGGDFYDFFLIDHDHLGLVIADVSGKGVGAAMFMMISKTFLNGQAHFDLSPAKILSEVNNRLCENNTAEMFVTVWLGILDLRTGLITASNGGHEYPFVQRAGGKYELYKDKHGLALGAYPGVKYSEYEIQLNKGDAIFVYTDGVAEATNAENELFGTDRALEVLNRKPDRGMSLAISNLMAGIDAFVKNAPQFDDITMLALRYLGDE